MHTESPTFQFDFSLREPITERPKPYIPREPPIAEKIPCYRCGHLMEAIRQKDAGWLKPIAEAPGREDGEEILGYACMNEDCLEGKFDSAK